MILADLFSPAGDTDDEWVLFVDTSSHNGQMLAFNSRLEPLHDMRWGKEKRHDRVINSYFSDILQKQSTKSLKAIVCVQGPGSFTGLRVSAVFSKALSLALSGLPIYGVSSFIIPAISILEQGLVSKGTSFNVHAPSIQEMTFLAQFEYNKADSTYLEKIDRTNSKLRKKERPHEFIISKSKADSFSEYTSVPNHYHDHTLSLFKKPSLFSYHTVKTSYLDFYPLFLRRSEAEEKFNYDKKSQ